MAPLYIMRIKCLNVWLNIDVSRLRSRAFSLKQALYRAEKRSECKIKARTQSILNILILFALNDSCRAVTMVVFSLHFTTRCVYSGFGVYACKFR